MLACVSGPAVVAVAVTLLAVLSATAGVMLGRALGLVEHAQTDEVLTEVLEFAEGADVEPAE
jgi:hypothetical protein